MSFRIISPYRSPVLITPTHLQEVDFERRGTSQAFGDRYSQNARLTHPLTVTLADGQVISYPKHAYIRIYEGAGSPPSVHLISVHPLP